MPFKDRHCKIALHQSVFYPASLPVFTGRVIEVLQPAGFKAALFCLLFALTAFFTVVLSVNVANADFYSYVDANGVLHISNVPVSKKFSWMMPEKGGGNKGRVGRGGPISYDTLIYTVSKQYGVDPNLIKAVVKAESDYNPAAISRAGARGLMQLMPGTARMLGVKNIHDPAENVRGGTKYLSGLIKKFDGKLPMALAAYNAGAGTVRKYGRIPPFKETRQYVRKVLLFYDSYSGITR